MMVSIQLKSRGRLEEIVPGEEEGFVEARGWIGVSSRSLRLCYKKCFLPDCVRKLVHSYLFQHFDSSDTNQF